MLSSTNLIGTLFSRVRVIAPRNRRGQSHTRPSYWRLKTTTSETRHMADAERLPMFLRRITLAPQCRALPFPVHPARARFPGAPQRLAR